MSLMQYKQIVRKVVFSENLRLSNDEYTFREEDILKIRMLVLSNQWPLLQFGCLGLWHDGHITRRANCNNIR